MKTPFLATALLVLAGSMGCKSTGVVEPNSLVTKWTLVRDSTSVSIGSANSITEKYTGVAGDYFDFRTDGKCYTREGNVYDTLAYQLIGSNRINIEKFGFSSAGSPCTIDPFTAHKATITSPDLLSPGGTAYRSVSLTK